MIQFSAISLGTGARRNLADSLFHAPGVYRVMKVATFKEAIFWDCCLDEYYNE